MTKAATYIVDGAVAIIDTALPTFAIVSKDLYRDLLLTRTEDVLAYLNMALGLEEGTDAVPSASCPVTRRSPTTPSSSARSRPRPSYELPGSPSRVQALNIANGGVDCGLFGYMAAGFNDDGRPSPGLRHAAGRRRRRRATTSRSGRRGRRTRRSKT